MMNECIFRTVPVGDSAVMIVCGLEINDTIHQRVRWVMQALQREGSTVPVIHWVPSYTTVLGSLDASQWSAEQVAKHIESVLNTAWLSDAQTVAPARHRLVDIPVTYGGDFGPDLLEIANARGIMADDIAHLHAQALYHVYLIGFVPGFPYMAGLPEVLATPRKRVPRVRVPAGSVGIGGVQTGIYPAASPGGWQLIGRTPLKLFDINRESIFLLKTGDDVRFRPISEEEFNAIAERTGPTGINPTAMDSSAGKRTGGSSNGSITVLEPGLLTTVQDLGRTGFHSEGVARSGAMDRFASQIANVLVGNPVSASVLECTLTGPKLEFHADLLVSVTGGECEVFVDNHRIPLWTTIQVNQGSVMSFGGRTSGCRNYIAVCGGFDVPYVMGSQSTDVGQGFGGFSGRGLHRGDVVEVGQSRELKLERIGLGLAHSVRPQYPSVLTIGYIPSKSPSAATDDTVTAFAGRPWVITPQSNRMGIRLTGTPVPATETNVISEPVVPGTIQCPPSGEPIVLMSEAQTVGGYPTIGVVCTADLDRLAQAIPGVCVRFEPISEREARNRLNEIRQCLRWLERY